MENSTRTRRRGRRRLVTKKLLIIWLVILALECVSVATMSAFWVAGSGQTVGTSAAAVPFAPPPFLLPEPTLPPAPSPTPTRVFIYRPTPTETPTPEPTVTLTPAPTLSPPTAAAPLPVPDEQPTAEIEAAGQIEHVIIISIDGLRPDALFAADAPTLDSLIAQGAYSPNAQTVKISETLPSHASMVTGVIPERHTILWGVPYMGWPGIPCPTIFSLAHNAGLNTAMVFGKEKLNYLVLPDSVDELFGVDTHDTEIKDHALEFVRAGLPNLMFIHFPDVDRVGHGYGWMSPNQLQAITFVDNLIAELMAVLDEGGYLNSTLLIVTSDHGGHGMRHGDDSPIDRTIPWLAVGPGVPQGVTLATNINTYDTGATALHALNLPVPEDWDGKPVMEIFTQP